MTAGGTPASTTGLRRRRIDLRRTIAVLLLIGALAPGVWLREERVLQTRTDEVTFRPLPHEGPARGGDGLRLVGAWQLTSSDPRFGSYSALVVRSDGRLRAYSDSGQWLEFAPPGMRAEADVEFGSVRDHGGKAANDVEAAAHDQGTGTTWLALEFTNTIRRINHETVEVAPPAMAGFPANGGAEAMARLPDGRFVVLAEGAGPLSPMRRTGLLFATDPLVDDSATVFAFDPPPGYDPTDAAALPDGRVMILLRALSLRPFPAFGSKLVVADPAEIEAGEPWPWREVAHLSGLAPRENYEGLAVMPGDSGVVLWLISDANRSVLLQRTLLLKLVWDEGVGGGAAAPGLRRP